MRLVIRRVGGMLPTLRPSSSHDVEALDQATREALDAFMALHRASAQTASHAEAMVYIFEVHAPKSVMTCSAAYTAIPEALKGLLPGPGP